MFALQKKQRYKGVQQNTRISTKHEQRKEKLLGYIMVMEIAFNPSVLIFQQHRRRSIFTGVVDRPILPSAPPVAGFPCTAAERFGKRVRIVFAFVVWKRRGNKKQTKRNFFQIINPIFISSVAGNSCSPRSRCLCARIGQLGRGERAQLCPANVVAHDTAFWPNCQTTTTVLANGTPRTRAAHEIMTNDFALRSASERESVFKAVARYFSYAQLDEPPYKVTAAPAEQFSKIYLSVFEVGFFVSVNGGNRIFVYLLSKKNADLIRRFPNICRRVQVKYVVLKSNLQLPTELRFNTFKAAHAHILYVLFTAVHDMILLYHYRKTLKTFKRLPGTTFAK